MEALTRLVSESFARHGFDCPVDYRRLHWSRGFPCESPRSLLLVPSRPGVFGLAEEVAPPGAGRRTPDVARRMLAVLHFCEADDMAFVLDRMFSRENPMRSRLASGRCSIRYVVLQDPAERRSICNALNQWLISSTETATGIGAHFATSLELTDSDPVQTSVGRTLLSPTVDRSRPAVSRTQVAANPAASTGAPLQMNSTTEARVHCPPPFPSGF